MILPVLLLLSLPLRDHGPGTSGGGLQTQSAETLAEGKVALGLRFDYARFESLSKDEIRSKTFKVDGDHAHLDTVDWTLLQTLELSYGVTDDIQLGYALGWYRASDLQEGHLHGDGSYGFHEFGDVSGGTDHWLTGKWRLMKGEEGQFAVFGGVKLPLGDDDEIGEDGDRNRPLEPSVQPGSGAFDVQIGAAYSRWLTEQLALDASIRFIYPFEARNFKIGERIEVGTAVSYRLTEFADDYPQLTLFAEAILRWQHENLEDDEEVVNSGGTTLFLSPGARLAVTKRTSFFVAPQFPVAQSLNDEQQETEFRFTAGISLAF